MSLLFALAFAFLPAASLPDPIVTVAIHVVLDVPEVPPGDHNAQCLGDRKAYPLGPIPSALFERYRRRMRAIGSVRDHFGFGTWTSGNGSANGVAFEPVDHVFVSGRLGVVRRELPGLLRAMRSELHQQEELAEVFGGHHSDLGEPRTRFEVVVPHAGASYAALKQVHVIFGDGGRSGASQYDDATGIHIYSSESKSAAARVARALQNAGFRYTSSPSTFIAVDAPRCAAGS